MKTVKLITFLILAGFTCIVHAQNPKGKFGSFALTNASIETVTKGVINNGTVLISNGKIAALGNNVQIPEGTTVIDCKGLWIYPGMIDGGTKMGLIEFGQVAQASDVSEVGDVVPQM